MRCILTTQFLLCLSFTANAGITFGSEPVEGESYDDSVINPVIEVLNYPKNLWPKDDSLYYYRIGGGRTFTSAPKMRVTEITLGSKANVTGLSCSKFDPNLSLSNTLNAVKRGLEDAWVQMQSAASAVVASLPGYILQTIDPGLYDLFMNSVLRAEAKFRLATKTCERMQAEMSQGKDPYEDLVQLSMGNYWKVKAGSGGFSTDGEAEHAVDDINDVVDTAPTSGRDEGIRYIGGERRGGLNDDPITTSEISKAGYNMLIGRSVTDSNPFNPGIWPEDQVIPPLVKRFDDPDDVQTWIRMVFGDLYASTCQDNKVGCQKSEEKAGQGLRVVIAEESAIMAPILQNLYDNSWPMSIDNLSAISAPGVIITRQVINAIQEMNEYDANVFLSKLLNEVATSRVINDAMLVRETVKVGMRESNVASNSVMRKKAFELLQDIDDEIDSIMREKRIKQELISDTVSMALMKHKAESTLSNRSSIVTPQDPSELEQGVIRK